MDFRGEDFESELKLCLDGIESLPSKMANRVVLITGATGLIGRWLVLSLLYLAKVNGITCTVIAQGRSKAKLQSCFADYIGNNSLELLSWDLNERLPEDLKIDYIIHSAAPTSSKEFVDNPVEVIDSVYGCTRNLLSYAYSNSVLNTVYLSSMEVYGQIFSESLISEEDFGVLDFTRLRSSYPQAKRLAELLCIAYKEQKKLPVKVARLAMTYGPGIPVDDARVINYFVNCIRERENIVLKTTGESKASVLYVCEAVNAILRLLISSDSKVIFNVANPRNYMSIKDMAEVAASMSDLQVKYCLEETKIYRNNNLLNLDISRMSSLGWNPKVCLRDIIMKCL